MNDLSNPGIDLQSLPQESTPLQRDHLLGLALVVVFPVAFWIALDFLALQAFGIHASLASLGAVGAAIALLLSCIYFASASAGASDDIGSEKPTNLDAKHSSNVTAHDASTEEKLAA